ncbi:MAG TPA: class I SAM-dependent methyltransferase [Thermoanaerobaculia bacterium]|jgi:predicted O-methyltransferase YrrM|nr:class I SAM-dependent methyltransferase [Thermoanaerobaculia bacterium]
MNTPATEHPAAQFSSEFGKAHGPNWLEWLGHLKGLPGIVGLELGTWLGESAEWAIDNVFTNPNARYCCVDTFEGSEEHRLAGIDCAKNEEVARARLARFGERAKIIRARSDEYLRRVLTAEDLYFVYVDAAHDSMNVLRDAVLAFDLLRPGGVMVFDDYEWKVMRDEIDRPKLAIDSFMACYARRFEVIGMGWQVALKKVA